MITYKEYYQALRIIKEYLNQEPPATHVKLLGIYDSHHDYSYLEISKEYKILKWYPCGSYGRGCNNYNGAFDIYVGGKSRHYKVNSNMMLWEFIKL